MSRVTLYQSVYPPGATAGMSTDALPEIWEYNFITDHLPDVGDRIFCPDGSGEVGYGFDLTVKNRYWELDGSVVLEMVSFQHDPPEMMESVIHVQDENGLPYRKPWRRDEEKSDLNELFRSTGWTNRR